MAAALSFLWLEITGKCQLACGHCYADSGPRGTHGVMRTSDWFRVIDEARELRVPATQFIGGEPTLHPHLPKLVERAVASGIEVEIYSNLGAPRSALSYPRRSREELKGGSWA